MGKKAPRLHWLGDKPFEEMGVPAKIWEMLKDQPERIVLVLPQTMVCCAGIQEQLSKAG